MIPQVAKSWRFRLFLWSFALDRIFHDLSACNHCQEGKLEKEHETKSHFELQRVIDLTAKRDKALASEHHIVAVISNHPSEQHWEHYPEPIEHMSENNEQKFETHISVTLEYI